MKIDFNPLKFLFGFFALHDSILVFIITFILLDMKYFLVFKMFNFKLNEIIQMFIIIFSVVGIAIKRS